MDLFRKYAFNNAFPAQMQMLFYSPINSAKPSLKYVWKVEGDQIASVFFYDWKSSGRAGKSMYVLTKSKLSNSAFEGVTYSTMELPIIKNGDDLSVAFFSGDPSDPALQNCNEGRDLATGKNSVCAYKDAGSIKNIWQLNINKLLLGHGRFLDIDFIFGGLDLFTR